MKALFNIPNLLSLGRIGFGAACLALIAIGSHGALLWCLALMLVAEGSDVLDGALARRTGQQTDIGRYLDTTCDAIFHLSIFLAFLAAGWMALWMIILIYSPEIFVPYARSFAKQIGVALPSWKIDAAKAAIHGASQIAIVLIVLLSGGLLAPGSFKLIYVILVLDVAAALAVLVLNILPLVRAMAAGPLRAK